MDEAFAELDQNFPGLLIKTHGGTKTMRALPVAWGVKVWNY
jgi:hypothetical protein